MAALPTDLGIPGCGPDSMPAFGGLVLRAIALAWTDPDFKEALLYPPGPPHSECIADKRHKRMFAPAANLLFTIRLCPSPT